MSRARVTQYVIETLIPTDTFSLTSPSGAGVSQYLVEVLGGFDSSAKVTQYLVEVLLTEDENQSSPDIGGAGGVDAYGFAT